MTVLQRAFLILIFQVLLLVFAHHPISAQEALPSETLEASQSSDLPATSEELNLPFQQPKAPEYSRGEVIEVLQESRVATEPLDPSISADAPPPNTPKSSEPLFIQKLKIQRIDTQEIIELNAGTEFQPLTSAQRLQNGTQVILAKQETSPGVTEYVIADVYRLPILLWLAAGFFLLVVIITRKQGVLAILGMLLSFAVLINFIIPHILAGENPVLIALIGCSVVAVLTVYLSHGFSQESHIALFSMIATLLSVSALSWAVIHLAHLAGLGSEEAYFLQFTPTAALNLRGLLLGGIMLGTLGVLDDITIAQVSVVTQLRAAKPNIELGELYERSLAVGKDHVASLVNTLILAYAGSSLPLFLLFQMNEMQPAWVSLNSEIIAEEVVRTLTGSIGLVLAVPLTTIIASYFALRDKNLSSKQKSAYHAHHSHTHTHSHTHK